MKIESGDNSRKTNKLRVFITCVRVKCRRNRVELWQWNKTMQGSSFKLKILQGMCEREHRQNQLFSQLSAAQWLALWPSSSSTSSSSSSSLPSALLLLFCQCLLLSAAAAAAVALKVWQSSCERSCDLWMGWMVQRRCRCNGRAPLLLLNSSLESVR